MNKLFFSILLTALTISLGASAEKTEEPLPDYVALFNEADTLIRSIDATTPCTNYYRWVEQALDAKNQLKFLGEIEPWLEELASTYTNNWRILHAVAYGRSFGSYHRSYEKKQWLAINLMDRAYHLLQIENPPADQALRFYEHYISMLIATDLRLKTTALTYPEWHQACEAATNNLVFYKQPASYASATNNGELIRWLFHEKPTTGQSGITLAEFAVLTVGTHINVPLQERPHMDYDAEPTPLAREILASLKDDETVEWGSHSNEYRIVKLPEAYHYISAFEQRAEQGNKTAAETLGYIFVNRCQLERAAHWFEMAGRTNDVHDIRANQGIFLQHGPYIYGKPVTIDYFFRNGSEVEFDIYPLNAGSNLLARLITRQVSGTEMKLLDGKPNTFMELHAADYAGLPGTVLYHWTLPLAPLPDHRDAAQSIDIPELECGNYLLRATLKDGNKTETILHIYNTVLYRALYYDPESCSYYHSNYSEKFNILCDALTAEPRANHELHLCKLSGGVQVVDKKKKDGPLILDHYIRRPLSSEGTFMSDDISSSWDAIDLTQPQTPFVSAIDAHTLSIYDQNYSTQSYSDYADFITTDRPVYRPGDTGYLKLWYKCFRSGIPAPDVKIKSQRNNYTLPLEINPALSDGENEILDPFSGADYSFTIPENAPLGGYRCQFLANRPGYQSDFRVEEYRAPEFKITPQLENDSKVRISADYTYGKPLTAGSISGHLSFEESHTHWFYPPASFDAVWGKGYWWNGAQFTSLEEKSYYDRLHCRISFTNELNQTGQTWIDLSTNSNAMNALELPGYFNLNFTATDPSGKQISDWSIVPTASARGPQFCCWLDKAFYSITESIQCHTSAKNPNEILHLEISRLGASTPFAEMTITQQITTLNPLPAGTYSLRIFNESGAASQPFEFAVIDDTAPFHADINRKTTDLTEDHPIRLITEKGLYHSNDVARLLIQVDRPGRYVYWFPRAINNMGFSRPEAFKMETVSKVVELPLNQNLDKGIIQSAVFTIVDGTPYTASANLTIKTPELDAGTIELMPDHKTYKPGDEVTLNIRTLGSSGEGRRCSVTLSVYNQSLDLWANENPPKIVDALFSEWRNCKKQTISTRSYGSLTKPLYPDWIMESILPSGDAPLSLALSLPEISCVSLFGCGASVSDVDPLEEDAANQEPRIREDFRDLAYWNATIITDSNGCASVSFPMPDGLVEWKIKAWAMNTNYAAEAETAIRCTKDFVANLNVPRFITEGDQLEISTSVRNHTTNSINCSAQCTINGKEQPAQTIEQLDADKEQRCYWTMQAPEPGSAEIITTVVSDSESDGMKRIIPIHPHGLLKRGGHGGALAGDKHSETVQIVIPEKIAPDSLKFTLHTTPNMLEAIAGALPFLADYPYGCTEQTLNRFLPSLVVMQSMQELGMDSLIATTNMPPGRETAIDPEEIRKRAQAGIDRLEAARKTYSGWGWNMDRSSPHDRLITAWTVRGLHQAAQVPGLMVDNDDIESPMEKILDEMEEQLKQAAIPTNNVKIANVDAFETLVLSELGTEKIRRYDNNLNDWIPSEQNREVLLSYMEHLINHADQLSLYGKILLANAYDRQDLEEQRDRLVAFVEQYLEHDSKTGRYWLRTQSNDWWWYWYNDDIELHAWYLKLLNRIDPHGEKAAGVALYLMQNRIYGDHWKSTRDTAICIEALAEFAKNNHSDSPEETITISSLNGAAFEDPEGIELEPGTNTLTIASPCGSPLFYDASWQYYSKEDPITPESCDLVSITRTYSRMENGTNVVIHPDESIQTGVEITVELKIVANQPLEYLLAEDRKPAGFETIDTHSGYHQGSFHELHDERVSFYLGRIQKGETVLTYRIRAEHAGTISALPATVELMYEPRQAANAAECKLKIYR